MICTPCVSASFRGRKRKWFDGFKYGAGAQMVLESSLFGHRGEPQPIAHDGPKYAPVYQVHDKGYAEPLRCLGGRHLQDNGGGRAQRLAEHLDIENAQPHTLLHRVHTECVDRSYGCAKGGAQCQADDRLQDRAQRGASADLDAYSGTEGRGRISDE